MSTQPQIINNRYQIKANVGADRSGFFLSLQDTSDGKKYYTKLIKIDDNRMSAKALYDIQMRMKRLTQFSHTNIISVYEPELAPEGLLLRQTELKGYSLKNLMQKNGRPLPLKASYRIALDIASALAALHSEGLVHGSLDPSHIWIDDQGKNYLSFLELPPAFDMDCATYQMPSLTPNAEPQPDSDIFSFGVLLLEMCTSLAAYRSGGDETDVEEFSHEFAYYRDCVSESVGLEVPDLVPILARCLTDNKAQRYKNGEELYWAIRALLEKDLPKREDLINTKKPAQDIPQTEKTDTAPEKQVSFEKPEKKKKKASALPFLLVFLLLICSGAGLWFLKPELFRSIRLPDFLNFSNPTAIPTPQYKETAEILYITQTAMKVEADRRALLPTATETPLPTATETPTPTQTPQPRPISPQIGRAIRWNADDSVMAAVPAVTFTMGMDQTFLFEMDGILPKHSVMIDAFWIDRTEITQAQYARCVSDGVCRPIERIADEWIGDDLPIMNVQWTDALSYCTWAGKRLPTEAQWELAARGTDERLYPWGNFSQSVGLLPNRLHAAGIDSQDVSPYGAMDMAGNVSEWVNDFYSETRLIGDEALNNPSGPVAGNMHTVKGGSFLSDDPEASRFTFNRFGAAPDSTQNLGFRCVVNASDVDTGKASEEPEQLTLAEAVQVIEQPADCTNRARFVSDVTIPDGTAVSSGEWITKTWLLENYGTCTWGENYKVVWSDENYENAQQLFDIGTTLAPGEQGEISVTFRAQGSGLTHISFLLADADGKTFGLGERGRGDLYIEYTAQ